MLNSNLVKKAHQMAREIKAEYPEVDYKAQLGLCLSYLLNGGNEMEDARILKLREMASNEANYNKVWNEVEELSKKIRGRKFNRKEQLSFKYKSINIVNLAIEILKEEVKTINVEQDERKTSLPKSVVLAKFKGFDAETGERIEEGDFIQFIEGLGWVRADNC